jgi:FixJ family two-component response regulator
MDKTDDLARPRVLIVEDDEAVRASLRFALELDGFAVDVFKSGEDLLRSDRAAAASCAVLDERLPGLSGLQTLTRLRQVQPDIPGIIITTHPSAHLRQAATHAGAPILEKPLQAATLCAAIRSQIDPRR